MWRSHTITTTDVYGHYDIWHTLDHHRHHHHHLLNDSTIRTTPCVSLLQKGQRMNDHRLCDRPYSPFAGFYDQQDVYVGCEYDIFGGESSTHSSTMNVFCDDPFSAPFTPTKPPSPRKRIQQDDDNTLACKRYKMEPPSRNVDPSSRLFSSAINQPYPTQVDTIVE
ncbi:hypothetical protein BC941DRAFT_408887 [Chlamydoabsidia padenii]|nr:hypothetical protein BC941DRAFT_408887 [Chlamydoabsidia padenii]